jgi:hypothetical protein
MGPMSLRREDVDRMLAAEFVESFADASVDEIRTQRATCRRVEYLVSYLRRVVQGQIDLVTAELDLREHGTPDHRHSRVEDLPGILAGTPRPGASEAQGAEETTDGGRQATSLLAMPEMSGVFAEDEDLAPDEIAAVLSPALHELSFSGGMLPGANLASFTDTEVRELLESLREHESSLSAERRVLHERIDQLQTIVVECYKSGVADADTLLGDQDGGSSAGLESHLDSEGGSP